MLPFSVISINLQTAAPEVLKALNHHQDLMQQERQPSEPLRPFEARLAGWRSESAYSEVRCWAVFAEDQKTILGNAWIEASLSEDNRQLVDYNILVLSDYPYTSDAWWEVSLAKVNKYLGICA
ncbi:MAG: hypothetical protein U0350_25915 [Caldilineaceae bacterium]